MARLATREGSTDVTHMHVHSFNNKLSYSDIFRAAGYRGVEEISRYTVIIIEKCTKHPLNSS